MSEHLSAESLEQYRQRALSPADVLRADDHLVACEVCRARAGEGGQPEQLLRTFDANLRAGSQSTDPDHLSYEQIVALVDDGLDRADREIAESHVEVCRLCTDEVDDLRVYRASLSQTPAEPESARPTLKPTFMEMLAGFRGLFGFATPLRLAVALALIIVSLVTALWWRQTRSSPEVARTDPPSAEERPDPSPGGTGSTGEAPALIVAELEDAGGRVSLDDRGAIKGLESLSPAAQSAVKEALTSGRVPKNDSLAGLSGKAGTLMSGSTDPSFSLLGPVGIVIRSERPRFSWRPLQGASEYTVTVLDSDLKIVAASPPISTTAWTPTRALERGRVYSWQVAALRDEQKIIAPSADLPESRFSILDRARNDELQSLEGSNARSHLARGILYAEAGLLEEAERELRALVTTNPKSEIARKLLSSVRRK